jgi:hypothetical protein
VETRSAAADYQLSERATELLGVFLEMPGRCELELWHSESWVAPFRASAPAAIDDLDACKLVRPRFLAEQAVVFKSQRLPRFVGNRAPESLV